MLEIVKTFDLLGSINQFLQEHRHHLGFSDKVNIRPRVINQEKGDLIIYTWNDVVQNTQISGPVTHVGTYDPGTQKHKVLWIYNQKVKMVSCTVNRERTLLGFTTLTRQDFGGENRGKSKDIYQAFLAELQSLETRVYTLNLQRSAFLKVQFLYPDVNISLGTNTSRDSYMLVFLHKESIGLYQIHLARIGDRGMIMSGQPKTNRIVRKFGWMQWDANHQRLYYVHYILQDNNTVPKLSAIQFHDDGTYDNKIDVTINFPFPYICLSARSHYVDIPLHPGIPDILVNAVVLAQKNGNFCFCYQEYIHSIRPPQHSQAAAPQEGIESVDLKYYVCMIHHANTLHGRATGLSGRTVAGRHIIFQWFGDYLMVSLPGVFCHLLNVNLEFEPCHHILLHNHSMHEAGRIPGFTDSATRLDHENPALSAVSVPADMSERVASAGAASSKAEEFADVDLTWASEGPSGLFPGSLNCLTPSSQPLTVQDEWIGDAVLLTEKQCLKLSSVVSSCSGFSRQSIVSGTCLYDSQSGFVWRVSLNQTGLIQAFKSACWQTQMAIIHFLVMQKKPDYLSIRQVFEVLTEDPTYPELHTFMAEYLVASTYNAMRNKLKKETLCLLNFTTAETFHDQFEKNAAGERLAVISYCLGSVKISTKIYQEQNRRQRKNDWDQLWISLRLKNMPPLRFSHDDVFKSMQDLDSDGQRSKKWTWVSETGEAGLNSAKLSNQVTDGTGVGVERTNRHSRSEMAFGSMPLFLKASQAERSQMTSGLTEQLLLSHLLNYMKEPEKAKHIAKEYVKYQVKQCRQLCYLLWSIYNQDNSIADERLLPPLHTAGTGSEYKLFQVFERFFLATQDTVFPRPSGFMSYFTALGFKCLNFSLFLQYVDRGVLQLATEFILQLLEDLPDGEGNENNTRTKFTIISRLQKPFAEDCLQRWNHPLQTHFTARDQVAKILQAGYERSRTSAQEEENVTSSVKTDVQRRTATYFDANSLQLSGDPMSFKPLTIFIRYLNETAAECQRSKRSSPLVYNTEIIKDAALAGTRAEMRTFDLSSMNF